MHVCERVLAYMCVCDGASLGLLNQLSWTVWMLFKLLKINNHNQKHRGCPNRRNVALRGFEHIIYKRQDNKSDFKRNGPCSVLGLGGGREEGNHKEWGIRAGEWCPMRDAGNLHGTVWGYGMEEDGERWCSVSTYKVALIAVSKKCVGWNLVLLSRSSWIVHPAAKAQT